MTASTPSLALSLEETASRFERTAQASLALPFDIAREVYAKAVHAGLIQDSMLASRDLERVLTALERASLGPWARQV